MVSRVYFAPIRAADSKEWKSEKVQRIFDAAGFGDLLSEGDLTAIKLHFGGKGNKTHVIRVPENLCSLYEPTKDFSLCRFT